MQPAPTMRPPRTITAPSWRGALFQNRFFSRPEVRRFLEQMGSGKIKELFVAESYSNDLENAIRETVDAYRHRDGPRLLGYDGHHRVRILADADARPVAHPQASVFKGIKGDNSNGKEDS